MGAATAAVFAVATAALVLGGLLRLERGGALAAFYAALTLAALGSAWVAVRAAGVRLGLTLERPENAVGGLAIGLALAWWRSMTLLWDASGGPSPVLSTALALAPSLAAMVACAAAAALSRRRLLLLLLAASPLLVFAEIEFYAKFLSPLR